MAICLAMVMLRCVPAAADQPPDLGVTLQCDAQHAIFHATTFQKEIETGSPDRIEKNDYLLGAPVFACHLAGHLIEVGSAGLRNGGPTGTCGSWGGGAFVVRLDRLPILSFGAGTCLDETVTTIDLRLTRGRLRRDMHGLLVLDGQTCTSTEPGLMPRSHPACSRLIAEPPIKPKFAPRPPGFRLVVDAAPAICKPIMYALVHPNPPAQAPGSDDGLPHATDADRFIHPIFADRLFIRWHTENPDHPGMPPIVSYDNPFSSYAGPWAWTRVDYLNDGFDWLVAQRKGYPFTIHWDVAIRRGKDPSDGQGYLGLHGTELKPSVDCEQAGEPLFYPTFMQAKNSKGQDCQQRDVLHYDRGVKVPAFDSVDIPPTAVIEFLRIKGVVHTIYLGTWNIDQGSSFANDPVEQGGDQPFSAVLRVVRFDGLAYKDECLIATGPGRF